MRKILFLSALPTDTQSGGGAYSRVIIDALRKWCGHERVCICEGEFIANVHAARSLSVAQSIFSIQPSKALYAQRSGVFQKIPQSEQSGEQVVVFNGPDVFAGVSKKYATHKKIMIVHNIESEAFDSQLESKNALIRFIFRIVLGDVRKFRRLEKAYFADGDAVIAISQADAEWIIGRFPKKPVFVAPPSFSYKPVIREKRRGERGIRVGFLGKMDWWPNRHGVDWFLNEAFPAAAIANEFHLFGAGTERYTESENRIFGHGFVQDIGTVWRSIDVFVCPIFKGGGANVKLAEALYNGVPVIATPFAAKGLSLSNDAGAGIRIPGDADEWRRLLRGEELVALTNEAPGPEISQRFSRPDNTQKLVSWLDKNFNKDKAME